MQCTLGRYLHDVCEVCMYRNYAIDAGDQLTDGLFTHIHSVDALYILG